MVVVQATRWAGREGGSSITELGCAHMSQSGEAAELDLGD